MNTCLVFQEIIFSRKAKKISHPLYVLVAALSHKPNIKNTLSYFLILN